MEPVAGITDPLPPGPAEGGAYVGGQGFGHQRVVPDRNHVGADGASHRWPGRGGQQRPRRPHLAVRSGDHHPGAVPAQPRGWAVLDNAYAEPLGRRRQAPGQPGRVDQGHAMGVVDGREIGGRGDLGLRLLAVQQPPVQALSPSQGVLLGQVGDLPVGNGDVQLSGPLEVAVDPVPGDRCLDRVQGVLTHPQQRGQLGCEPLKPVGQPVGQAGRTEPAVPARRSVGDPVGLQQHHATVGPLLRRLYGGPQPGEPAADHHQIGLDRLDQPATRHRALRPVQPVRFRRRVGQHPACRAGRHVPVPHIRHPTGELSRRPIS